MAISASTVFEIRTAGNDTNGGGYVTGSTGTDYSLQNSKNTVGSDISTTDAVVVGTSTLTSATANFGTTIVGNIIYLQGGTGSLAAGWYQVTARASTTSITLDRSVATGTGITMNIGGALLSIGMAGGAGAVAGLTYFIKYNASAFLITSASTNVSGGCFNGSNQRILVGYDTTRTLANTDTNRPTFQASGISTATIFAIMSNNLSTFKNMIVDGASLTSILAFGMGGLIVAENCKVMNCTNGGFNLGTAIGCEAVSCTTVAPFSSTTSFSCISHGNTVSGFVVSGSTPLIGCISYGNTGASSIGFDAGGAFNAIFISCTSYSNGSHGFSTTAGGRLLCLGCVAESNTGTGFNGSALEANSCAVFNNTGGTFTANNFNANNVTVTAGSVFTNAGSSDFSLNNTANRGALLRATNFVLNTKPLNLTLSYFDIGAAQHQNVASTGGSYTFVG